LLQTSFLWGQRCPLPFAPPAEQRRETPLQNQSHASWIHATLRLAQRQDADPQRSQRELIPCMSFLPLLELREYLRTILDTRSTLIDEIIDLYDRFMGIRRDRQRGMSLGPLAREHRASRTTIHRVLHDHASASSEQVA
jgi:hypothetical protein